MESGAIEYLRQNGVPQLMESLLADIVNAKPQRPYDYINLLTLLPPPTQTWPEPGTFPSLTTEEKQSCHNLLFNVFPIYADAAQHPKLLLYLEYMMQTLGAKNTFSIQTSTLRNFILRCYDSYDDRVPFHNFRHVFNVAQTYFVFATEQSGASNVLKPIEIFAGFVAALTHDLGHPGTNNPFHVATQSAIAMRYNNISVLENYHAAYAMHILKKENLMENHAVISPEDVACFNEIVISSILATDVSKHKSLFATLPLQDPDWTKAEHRRLGIMMLVECADISNEIRSHSFSEMWAPLVEEEFFRQGDRERQLGMKPKPAFTRGEPDIASEQIGFITYLCVPAYKACTALFPKMQASVDALERNKEAWEKMKKK